MSTAPLPLVFQLTPECRETFLSTHGPAGQPLVDQGLLLSGLSELCRGFEIGRRTSDFHVLIFTLEGCGHFQTPEGGGVLQAGDLWVVPVGVHQHYWVEDYWKILWFHPAVIPMWSFLAEAPSHVRKATCLEPLASAVSGYLRESFREGAALDDAAVHYAQLITIYLNREMRPEEEPGLRRQREMLQGLWADVNANLQHPWSVRVLAARLNLSESTFTRLVRTYHDVPPMTMVTRLRMRRAMERLRKTDEPVYQIAARLGYENPFAFTRAFRRYSGQSPRTFRQEGRVG